LDKILSPVLSSGVAKTLKFPVCKKSGDISEQLYNDKNSNDNMNGK
jgi:hypothetical protein